MNPAMEPWLERAMAFVAQRAKDPPAASRAYGLVSAAMADATAAAWHWKYRYHREPLRGKSSVARAPDPSYPSEHAAIEGAASRVLEYAFPEQPKARLEEQAEDAARLRVTSGASLPSDADAGLELGRQVADRVIARARRDGFTRKWDGRRPRGFGYWAPPPGSEARPVQPLAGSWRTWVMKDGGQFRTPKPPRLDSAAAGEVLAHLFPDDAKFWRARGEEAGISRLYGGIHWRIDHTEGSRIGKEIGRLAVKRAQEDGAER